MQNNITGIVISAGLSGRMNNFKPLLKLDNGNTFLGNIVEKLLLVCNKIVIVTGHNSVKVLEHIELTRQTDKIIFTFNENYKAGMFSSLQTGLTAANSKWYLYHFVDQPSLPQMFYNNFTNQIDDRFNWIQPTFEGRNGHPILLDNMIKDKILESDQASNLREISKEQSIKKKFWKCDTDLIFQDIDTNEDYKSIK